MASVIIIIVMLPYIVEAIVKFVEEFGFVISCFNLFQLIEVDITGANYS